MRALVIAVCVMVGMMLIYQFRFYFIKLMMAFVLLSGFVRLMDQDFTSLYKKIRLWYGGSIN